jgi:hypothetical protein
MGSFRRFDFRTETTPLKMNLNIHGNCIRSFAIAGALCLGMGETLAQHYPAGAEGIKAATLPPPGVYFRDYNIFYSAPDANFGPVRNVFVYVNAPRVIWITDKKILGADYGMDLIVPFGYMEIEYLSVDPFGGFQRRKASRFGLGDIQIEPLLLSWHTKQFDFAAGYAIWAPTGDFDRQRVVNIGQGYWTHMLTGGLTWNIDEEKTWAVSVLNRYEISHEQKDTRVTPGQQLTVEAGISKSIMKGVDVGVVGYWRQQTTEDSGSDSLRRVGAAGPELSAVIPQVGVIASLRYLREFAAENTIEGNTVVLTLTKRF